MKTAIITYIDDNRAKNLEDDFLFTLRKKACYKAAVFVIYYGKNRKFVRRIQEKYKVKVIFANNKFRASNQRNIDIARLLKKMPRKITNVSCFDAGDLWFQAPIEELFELTKDNYGFVEEDCSANEHFNLSCINQIADSAIRKCFLDRAKGYNLANSGMIAGPKEKLAIIMEKIAELTAKINQDFFALDQAIFNYVIEEDGKGIVLATKYNYTLKSRINEFEVKNNLLYDIKTKELINVVHNIGGAFFRVFERGRKSIGFVPPKIPQKLPGAFWGITTFFNPVRYKNKIRNYRVFRESSKEQGLNLLAIELAFGKAPFELKKEDAEILIQVRTDQILWQKERLINIGIKNLPPDCDKFAWLDADIIFLNDNWIEQTCKLLEKYVIVQPFSNSIRLPKKVFYLDPSKTAFGKQMDLENYKSFGAAYRICQLGKEIMKKDITFFCQVGFVWAARKHIFEREGVFDKSVFPNVDLWMARAFYNCIDNDDYYIYFNNSLRECYAEWFKKIYKKIRSSVYYTEGTILHLWHGFPKDRNYPFCYKVLIKKYDFDPEKDIKMTPEGIWTWASKKPEFHKAVEKYFLMRKEKGWSFNDLLLLFYAFPNICFRIADFFIKKIDRYIGLFGLFFKKMFPPLYFFLRKTKEYFQWGITYFKPVDEKEIKKMLKNNWNDYEVDLCPKDRRMNILEDKKVEGMSTENVCFLINEIVRHFAKRGVFLEVGTWRGRSVLSAALFNNSTRCITIDNFSQFDNDNNNEKILKENLKKFDNPPNIEFYRGDYRKVIKKIFSKEPNLKVSVYFYDGNHSYQEQINGLRIALPYLARKCLIIIDDSNWEQVETANQNFIEENPDFKSLLKIKTEGNNSKDWWNGIEIIGRGV